MEYALLICRDESQAPLAAPEQEAFAALLERLGPRLKVNTRLRPSGTATTVKVRDGGLVIADGPFAETKEQVAGVLVVECEDLDEAVELAAQIPVARLGAIEVRPVWPL
ncbi:MAG TPA: YciI family protein [Candidatus Dormibacteraeota bacterium]|nr:YciI family protein [Candidatus Dormibacteraeota bacterium]